MYAIIPASRVDESPERPKSRAKMGSDAGAVAPPVGAGTLNITSKTLPAAIKTSVCTLGAAGAVVAPTTCTPGTGLPSSAINVNPATVAACPAPEKPVVCDPTIEGTCIRRPAFTRRAKTVPVIGLAAVPGVAANSEVDAPVLLNGTPLIRK